MTLILGLLLANILISGNIKTGFDIIFLISVLHLVSTDGDQDVSFL